MTLAGGNGAAFGVFSMPFASYRKNGGIHFLAIGRLRFSFCIARKKADVPRVERAAPTYAMAVNASHYASDMLRPVYGDMLNMTEEARSHWQRVYEARLDELRTIHA
jgi:hypothetical protein